ncbi:hypothetical protein [Paenibacillus sp. FSL R5-0912]|uniref:hypothetical protein n=1 Tax=Paenibacillus sp. FSL R5-0912 TaxID=1536771 RepID=UPI0004F7D119|nr:hypothetical protein [Paenibacillus sp. FSL R5-0912]AIQ39708.1 hypothetical protein R50912_06430 [Paenibacillus sp. FSL R5-0912]
MKKTMLSKTMVGRTAVKALLATALLAGVIVGQVGPVSATAAKPTAAPIMRDNLSKYGLVKDVELPVTVTAGGLSYTLEKIMIYDFNSKDAINLRKTYKYGEESSLISKPTYFVWTKITIKNNSKKIVSNDKNGEYWVLSFKGLVSVDPVRNWSRIKKPNDKMALNSFILKPGEQLSTYQAYMYGNTAFDHFAIRLYFDGQFSEKFVVEEL